MRRCRYHSRTNVPAPEPATGWCAKPISATRQYSRRELLVVLNRRPLGVVPGAGEPGGACESVGACGDRHQARSRGCDDDREERGGECGDRRPACGTGRDRRGRDGERDCGDGEQVAVVHRSRGILPPRHRTRTRREPHRQHCDDRRRQECCQETPPFGGERDRRGESEDERGPGGAAVREIEGEHERHGRGRRCRPDRTVPRVGDESRRDQQAEHGGDSERVRIAEHSGEAEAERRARPVDAVGKEPRRECVPAQDDVHREQAAQRRPERAPSCDQQQCDGGAEVEHGPLELEHRARRALRPQHGQSRPRSERAEPAEEQEVEPADHDRRLEDQRRRGDEEQPQRSPAPRRSPPASVPSGDVADRDRAEQRRRPVRQPSGEGSDPSLGDPCSGVGT